MPLVSLKRWKAYTVRYVIDDSHLLKLWAVIQYFGVLREITDEEDRSDMLMQAQILLTGFIVGLEELPKDHASQVVLRTPSHAPGSMLDGFLPVARSDHWRGHQPELCAKVGDGLTG